MTTSWPASATKRSVLSSRLSTCWPAPPRCTTWSCRSSTTARRRKSVSSARKAPCGWWTWNRACRTSPTSFLAVSGWRRRWRRFLFRGGYCGLFQEEAVIVEVAIQPAGDLGGFGAEGGASAAQEDYGHDLAVVGIGERGEPAKAGAIFGAGAGLAQDFFFAEVVLQAAGGAVAHRGQHAG